MSEHEFTKNFCRLVTLVDMTDEEVLEYFDVVQATVPAKLTVAYTDQDEKVTVNVIAYHGENDKYIYEIILDEQLDLDEGEQISDELAEIYDFDFDFETSLEI